MAKVRNAVSFLAVAVLLATLANATTHIVGDSYGWNLGVDYKAWASRTTIRLGDNLLLTYAVGYHSVLHVTKADYDACRTSSPISYDYSGFTYFIPLTVGKTYIICGAPGHCEQGMKLEVNTLDTYSYYTPPPPISYSPYTPPSLYQPPSGNSWPPPTPTSYYPLPRGSNSPHRISSAGSFALMMILAAI